MTRIAAAPDQTARKQASTVQPRRGTAKLARAALVRSLKQSGSSAAQIASQMGVSVELIDGYLGIQQATTAMAAATKPITLTPPATAPAAKIRPVAAVKPYSPNRHHSEPLLPTNCAV